MHIPGVIGQNRDLTLRAEVPNTDGLIPAPGDQGLAVGRENEAADIIGMPSECQRSRVSGEVPQNDRAALRANSQLPPAWGKGHRGHTMFRKSPLHMLHRKASDFAVFSNIPKSDHAFFTMGDESQRLAIGREGH